ncbi:MAG: hypothetical protein M0Q93_04105 [Terrimicrobiaceae bacterium]|nr:hypothetical protein [Terrimicrobiaceae bacterium]
MSDVLHKSWQSFLAIFIGWIACNVSNWIYNIPRYIENPYSVYTFTDAILPGFLYTGIVIFPVWLLIFLPTHFLVPDSSSLRRPVTAALCGGLVGFLVMHVFLVIFALIASNQFVPVGLLWQPLHQAEAFPFLIGATVTGLTAALALSLFASEGKTV